MFRKMFEEHWQRQKRWDKYLGDGELVLRFAICIWVGFIFACVWVWPTNTFFFNSGLYADSDGRIYIGEKSWIVVYEHGKLVD